MKAYRYTYILLVALFSVMALSCEVDEVTDAPAADALVHKVFHATIEEDGLTKTMLDETAVDGVRGMLWDPGDVIGIGIQGSTFRKFTNVVAEPTANGVFEGDINEENTYFAIYPWQENKTMTTELTVAIPSVQTYRANSFDINMAPMVGKGNNGGSIYFQNLCGILAISMKGTDVIKSISLSAKDAKGNKAFISGEFSVDMGYENFPYPMPTEQSLTNVTIDCGEGVQLDSEKDTYFHMLLPPGTYYGLDLLITTSDARFMTMSTDKTLVVKRSVLTKTSALEFMENVGEEMITDLSLRGNSNCYIVPSEGVYSFDATVIGNGEFGIISGAGFHTETPEITPVSVDLLWEDRAGLMKSYAYDPSEGRVKFIVSDLEGNALIAAKDADGTILWSWHIWATDTPVDQKYVNSAGNFTVQDRNLGATRADRGTGDEWKDGKGTLYQWGRKDPFVKGLYSTHRWNGESDYTMFQSILEPTTVSCWSSSMVGGANWVSGSILNLWSSESKTIYDPCPTGYCVPSQDIWVGFTTTGATSYLKEQFNVCDEYDHGWNMVYDGVNTAWYPDAHYLSYHEASYVEEEAGHLWSSTFERCLRYDATSVQLGLVLNDIYSLPVRCMKDEGHVDLALPIVEMIGAKDATAESVTLTFNITDAGASSVTESGIIYSTTPGVSPENSQKVAATGSEYKVDLTGLSEGTRYYAIAYATNSYGTSYSNEMAFYTEFANYTNLSKYGTSNCYIVSEYGAYTFDASVRGNSTESVGIPASVEVLWETKNTTKVSAGEIIRSGSVELSGDFVNFVVNGVEGNALIAVKDALGTILWNWHIWVTDQPQEQHYINDSGDFYVLDRNLGATRADRGTGDEWKESSGFLYQWGRKDPFADGHYEWVQSQFTLKESIEKPMIYAARNSPWTNEWSDNLWDVSKTIYDPCPVGYKVSVQEIWNGFTVNGINVAGVFDYGWHFYIDSQNTAWYPANPHIGYMGHFEYHEDAGHAWCTTPSYIMEFSKSGLTIQSTSSYQAFPVRCMKE